MAAFASTRARVISCSCVAAALGLSSAAGCYRASALHVAAVRDQPDAVARILDEEHGNVEKKVANDRTPLHLAAARGSFDAAKALVDRGADVNAVDSRGNTPLILAANLTSSEIVALLLAKSPDIEHQKKAGRTALSLAARRGQVDICRVLIRAGADPKRRDEKGRTARGYATTDAVREALSNGKANTLRPTS